MPIQIVRKGHPGAQYIGRGSALGNPFVMRDKSMAERKRVIAAFEDYFQNRVREEGPLRDAVIDLYRRHQAGEHICLACFCAPLPCHGDIIAKFIESLPPR